MWIARPASSSTAPAEGGARRKSHEQVCVAPGGPRRPGVLKHRIEVYFIEQPEKKACAGAGIKQGASTLKRITIKRDDVQQMDLAAVFKV